VTIETDRVHKTRVLQCGSGFLSQHSKELVIGLGASERPAKLTINWPSGDTQVFTDVPLNARVRIVEGRGIETEALKPRSTATTPPSASAPASAPSTTWMYEPFPAPDVAGPAIVLLWSPKVDAARAARDTLERGAQALTRAGVRSIAIPVDSDRPDQVSLSYAILNRHLFMNRQDLRLPTGLLVDASGSVVKVYRDRVDVGDIVADASAIDVAPAERLARALPFPGTFYLGLPLRNYLPYGSELLDNGLDAAAVIAFERAARANPGASTLYRLGTLLARSGETAKARAAFEQALVLKPDLAEAHNDLGALLAQSWRSRRSDRPVPGRAGGERRLPGRVEQPRVCASAHGRDQEARALYEKALALQPDFPEALNNLGLLAGRAGDLAEAERRFREALARRNDYGEAANNLALVLATRGQADAAVTLLERLLQQRPEYEAAYVTLARIHLSADRPKEGIAALERLLQRNPSHAAALELLRQSKERQVSVNHRARFAALCLIVGLLPVVPLESARPTGCRARPSVSGHDPPVPHDVLPRVPRHQRTGGAVRHAPVLDRRRGDRRLRPLATDERAAPRRSDAAGENAAAVRGAARARDRLDRGAGHARGAQARGDPGPVLPRRLSNAEYDNTIRDLTGVDIRPAREFPVDPANTEGFDNSGESLTMSPALFAKYVQAARQVSEHLVLKPDGIAFAPIRCWRKPTGIATRSHASWISTLASPPTTRATSRPRGGTSIVPRSADAGRRSPTSRPTPRSAPST
jgi:tetratricopeptide (TPR) repeat protein